MDKKTLYLHILQNSGIDATKIIRIKGLSGGCIHNVDYIETNNGAFCCKTNNAKHLDLFETESNGLLEIAKTKTIRVPKIYKSGLAYQTAFLLLEYLPPAAPQPDFWKVFAQQLAQMHQCAAESFGFTENNYIGALPQQNHAEQTAANFFIKQRLAPQVKLAQKNGYIGTDLANKFEKAYELLPNIIPNNLPISLVHGDLWSGNFIIGPDGYATLIDPAAHYGNREAEMAFTTMFGGFDNAFYKLYQEYWPMNNGHQKRYSIYNIYNYLVHVNLFGVSYLNGVYQGLNQIFNYH